MRFVLPLHSGGTTRFGLLPNLFCRPCYLGDNRPAAKVDSSAILYLRLNEIGC
jgi:hypothetical protein